MNRSQHKNGPMPMRGRWQLYTFISTSTMYYPLRDSCCWYSAVQSCEVSPTDSRDRLLFCVLRSFWLSTGRRRCGQSHSSFVVCQESHQQYTTLKCSRWKILAQLVSKQWPKNKISCKHNKTVSVDHDFKAGWAQEQNIFEIIKTYVTSIKIEFHVRFISTR